MAVRLRRAAAEIRISGRWPPQIANHPFDEPKQWEIREINDIMNNSVVGWKQFTNPRHFAGYGRQKGWERDNQPVATGTNTLGGFTELTEEEIKQMELPF